MIRILTSLFVTSLSVCLLAGEGMWIPLLLENNIIADMQAAGLKLSASDIYSINNACLKDAVVMFGRGCTGEIISPDGLLITNHHCGYGRIQSHSTVEKDLLTEGFWAYSRDQELPNPGLTVSFLIRIEDVSEKVLSRITPDMSELQRAAAIDEISRSIADDAEKNTHYKAEIESFFFGSDYFLFVYEVFRDIRLVGTPPSSIGEFGGDTDNWVWPRHRGDFSLFRVYAGTDNKPADYAADNVPYKPKKYLTLSTKGIQEGDFTMVLGYPARTDQYMHSEGLEIITQEILPAKIKMREERLRIMSEEMAKSPETRLQYANKYQGVSNAWKKWVGVVDGAKRTRVITKKINQERMLAGRHTEDSLHTLVFVPALQNLAEYYAKNKTGIIASSLGNEAMESFEMILFASGFVEKAILSMNEDTTGDTGMKAEMKGMADGFFKGVNLTIDKRTMPGILEIYFKSADTAYFPEAFQTIHKRFHGDVTAYVDWLYKKSLFADHCRLNRAIDKSSARLSGRLIADPAFRFYQDFSNVFHPFYLISDSLDLVLQRFYRDYLRGLMAFDTNRPYYPDANFTMRIAYGKVEGYKAEDAVTYGFYTTTNGILEKGNLGLADYKVNEKLKQIIEKKDFSPYTTDSTMPVCFIASNHTSGGNSGSPVLDANGRLIGINFDRNWEGTISDYEFDPAVCRNISLDIRYVLFIIDKYAGASGILKELTIE